MLWRSCRVGFSASICSKDELGALRLGEPREADEFVEAAEFSLARDPEIGLQISTGSSVWALPMSPVQGEQVTLYYTFDETTVRLLSIERARTGRS